ncbi:MAG: IS200/IS605 family element transposase accessory protein TnpB [Methanosarcinales archaeon]|nr:IS200/IS605 family element transposase accessory protein TnpB [Methanosarcinales archaeon]
MSDTIKEFVGKMRKTFQYRIYPTRKQNIILLHVLSMCRKLYNDSLHDRKVAYQDCHCGLSYYDQAAWMKYIDYQGVYAHILQNVLRRVDASFQNFFRRVKNGETSGYPRFQGRNRYDSFTYPDPYGTGYKIEDGKLHLSKIGAIRIFQHREIGGIVKTCTIKRDGDQWYASFSVELPDVEKKEIETSVGVDVGITTLATLSDGTEIENPKTLDKYDSKVKKSHRDLSRKKKGSSNRNKQKIVLAGIYRKVRNARKDYLHKTSRILADAYDQIVFEDLQIKNMVKNHHLARSIHDASWSMLINFTTYKAEYAGGIVELVNPRNTSKQCSVCDSIQSMPLSLRTYRCPDCWAVMGRDHNAAINIKNRYAPADCGELTPVEMVV